MDEAKPTRGMRGRKVLRIGTWVLALVFLSLVAAHYAWLNAGSSEWVLKEHRNGISIWTQKTPGNPLMKGRARFEVQSTLGGIVKIVYDKDVHRQNNMMKVSFLEAQHAPGYFGVFNTFRQEMPWPFQRREFVLLSQHVQDPVTKAIELNAMAAPNKIPPSDCCVRLVHLHNRYTVTPLGGGRARVDFFWDIDLGGAFPYSLQNLALPTALYQAMDDFRTLIGKYREDEVDYISEPGTAGLRDMTGFRLTQD